MTTRRYAGKKWQGTREKRAYYLDTTPWGGYDSDEAVTLISESGEDISDTHLEGSPSVVNGIITTPLVKDLAAGRKYTIHISWKRGDNVNDAYGYIIGED